MNERRIVQRRIVVDRRLVIPELHRVAVTGPVHVVHGQDHHISDAISELYASSVTEFTTGLAFGVDTLAARIGCAALPDAIHHFIAPAKLHNDQLPPSLMREYYGTRHFKLEKMRSGTTYLDRNVRLVANCDVLLAFPETGRELIRSGTWHTVREARRKSKIIKFFPLDGSNRWVEVPEQCSLDLHLPNEV